MDKALEVIMVAVILIIASVVIIAMLQGQTESFGGFADDQTNSSNCGLSELEYDRAIDKDSCSETGSATQIKNDNSECKWTDNTLPDYYC